MNPPPPDRSDAVLGVTSAAAFVTPFLIAAVNLAVPSIARDFGADAASAGAVAQVFLLASAALLVPAGRYADLAGRARVFTAGLAATAATSLLCAAAPSLPFLVAARALQGAAAALVFGTGVALLTLATPPGRRGRALGLNVAATYLGLSAGPLLGGLLISAAGWRSIFLAVGAAGALAAAFARRALPSDPPPEEGFDRHGAALYALGALALLAGLSRPSAAGAALAAAGATLLALFTRRCLARERPLFPVRLFLENRVFACSSLAAAIHYGATFAVGFLVSLHLQRVSGLTPREAGLVLAAQPLVMALLSPAAGRLSDRVEPRLPATAGMLVTAAGLAALSRLGEGSGVAGVAAVLALLGAGYALFSSPNMSAIMGSVPSADAGVAAGSTGTARIAGQAASMSAAVLAFAHALPGVPLDSAPPAALAAAARPLYLAFAALALAGAALSAARGNMRGHPARRPTNR